MKEGRFTILICLYNKNIQESSSLQSLLRNADLLVDDFIILWDNSPNKLNSNDISQLTISFENFIYKHTPQNTVLSKIYNNLADQVKNREGYCVLLDDDSEIPRSFFQEIDGFRQSYCKNFLLLPQIFNGDQMVSPAKDYIYRSKFLESVTVGNLSSKNVTAINSGMVISNVVFQNGFRYDKRLNFYGTDNLFMYYYAKNHPSIFILNSRFDHDLSFNSSKDVANKIRIFKEVRRANQIIYANEPFNRIIVGVNNFLVGLNLCIRYKTIHFLV